MRIQLSSNFQVVELAGEEVNPEAIEKAIELVNKLGKEVVATPATTPKGKGKAKASNKPTEKQIKFADELGIDVRKMTKKAAREAISLEVDIRRELLNGEDLSDIAYQF